MPPPNGARGPHTERAAPDAGSEAEAEQVVEHDGAGFAEAAPRYGLRAFQRVSARQIRAFLYGRHMGVVVRASVSCGADDERDSSGGRRTSWSECESLHAK